MSPADVAAVRERLGMTRQQFADALECTLRTVQMWEAGDRGVPGPARVAMRLMLQPPAVVPSRRSRSADRGTPAASR
jgi:DNA-binding transcriptional regulator YiaG